MAGVVDVNTRPYAMDCVVCVPESYFVFKPGKGVEVKVLAARSIISRLLYKCVMLRVVSHNLWSCLWKHVLVTNTSFINSLSKFLAVVIQGIRTEVL